LSQAFAPVTRAGRDDRIVEIFLSVKPTILDDRHRRDSTFQEITIILSDSFFASLDNAIQTGNDRDRLQHSWEQITNTCPFNITHHPAISIPCGLGEGSRPIGLMLVAKHWQESTLYRAADTFECAGNWQSMGSNGKR
jgi:Asp-tRNA(Asn)/Glu-tRNA(Gln) amidotransferase A subunit family amidase